MGSLCIRTRCTRSASAHRREKREDIVIGKLTVSIGIFFIDRVEQAVQQFGKPWIFDYQTFGDTPRGHGRGDQHLFYFKSAYVFYGGKRSDLYFHGI